MYGPSGSWMDEGDNTLRTILSRSDSTLTVVWNAPGRYQINSNVAKQTGFHDLWADAYDYMYTNVIDMRAYVEDSLIYTSAAKDTVIGCNGELHSAVLPEGLQKIGKMAFAWNQGITEVTLPRDLQYVDDNAFWWDTNLAVVNFNADSCIAMCTGWHDNNDYYPAFVDCNNLATINIGENVKVIPDFAFSNYAGRMRGTLVIPDGVTYIGEHAFYQYNVNNTDSLAIVIGRSVEYIGDYAFYQNDHVSSISSRRR